MNTSYQVSGMTCGHCATSVSAELCSIEGVHDVQVDLASGTVSVTSSAPVDQSLVRAAVEEAGYQLCMTC